MDSSDERMTTYRPHFGIKTWLGEILGYGTLMTGTFEFRNVKDHIIMKTEKQYCKKIEKCKMGLKWPNMEILATNTTQDNQLKRGHLKSLIEFK